MADDGGVLGNLPNSRPGKRSAKREAGPAKKTGSADGVDLKHDMGAKRRHDPVPPPPSEDPVGAVVRAAAGVAGAGVKVAGAVGRELFRRLPRP